MNELYIKKPQSILQDKRLTPVEQDYLCLIVQLSNHNKCTASNQYFADYFGVKRHTAAEIISNLRRKNIIRSTEQKQGDKTVKRTIEIVDANSRESLLSDSRKSPKGIVGNTDFDSRKLPNLTLDNTLDNTILPAASRIIEAESAFESARQLYPGTKRSGVTELKDFQRHKDWKQAAPLLVPAIQREIEHKSKLKAAEKFCPEWKNFKTWIYQRCWEQEFPDEDNNQLTHECDPEVAMALERSLME